MNGAAVVVLANEGIEFTNMKKEETLKQNLMEDKQRIYNRADFEALII
jgi:hypothetical protein